MRAVKERRRGVHTHERVLSSPTQLSTPSQREPQLVMAQEGPGGRGWESHGGIGCGRRRLVRGKGRGLPLPKVAASASPLLSR